jgi:hypothetical protein
MDILTVVVLIIGSDFPICNVVDHQYTPVALFENSQYYVFWQDARFDSTLGLYSLCAARVGVDGTVIDPNGKIIYCDSAAGILDAAYDGTNFLVVFRDPNC